MSFSALDAYEDGSSVAYVAFHRHALHPELLVRALERVLPHYPLLTGRLGKTDGGQPAIALDDAGLPLEIAETHDTLTDWATPSRDAIGRFFAAVSPRSPRRAWQPLVRFRLTRLRGGGSALGIAFAHVLADGLSIASFLRDWSRAARGEAIVTPLWDRDAQARAFRADDFDARDVPIAARTYLGLHEASRRELAALYAHLLVRLPRWKGHAIPIRGAAIDALKSEAIASTQVGRTSSNDLLVAYLWKLVTRSLPALHRTRYFGVADLRRFTRGVPSERDVFGNMSGHLLIERTAGEVASMDLHALARTLRAETERITPHDLLAQEAWLRDRQLRGRMGRVIGSQPFAGDVCVSNCRYIPFYDLDFGDGRPYAFVLPTEPFPRIVIWPAADGDGCVLNVNLTHDMAARLVPRLTSRHPLDLAALR